MPINRPVTRRRLLLVLALAAAGLSAALRPASAQAAAPVVAAIQFAGRVNVQEAPLLRALSLEPGMPFTAEKMEADRKALLALGYFRMVAAAQRTEGGRTTITYRLVELPQVLHISVSGNTVVDRKSILEVISTQRGQVLCAPQLQDDVRALEQLYRERGYVTRLNDKLLEEATRTGILKFALLEVHIEAVELEGGTEELRQRARAVLTELPPRLYQPEAVTLDQRRLLKLRGIRHAVPKVQATEPGKVRILWSLNPPPVAPKPTTESNGSCPPPPSPEQQGRQKPWQSRDRESTATEPPEREAHPPADQETGAVQHTSQGSDPGTPERGARSPCGSPREGSSSTTAHFAR